MASRRDELRAHQFLKQRAVSALVIHQTDPEQPPFRRPTVSAFWGLGLALLGLAIAGILSFFTGGSSTLNIENGKNVLITDTGAKYVKLDGLLHPVLNFSSAELALQQHQPTQTVSQDQIAGMKPGPTIGIPNAPDDLPDTQHLWHGAWNMCTQPVRDSSGTSWLYKSVLTMHVEPRGGTAVDSSKAVVVRAIGGSDFYLVWQGYRHKLRNPAVDINGLAPGLAPLTVNSAWLASIPSGADIAPTRVADEGAPSTALGSELRSVRRGQIYVAKTGEATQYYLVLGNKLRPISQVQALIQLATPQIKSAYAGLQLGPLTLTSDQAPPLTAATGDPDASASPSIPPTVLRPDPNNARNTVCSSYTPGAAAPKLTLGPRVPTGGLNMGGRDPRTGTALVDRVVIMSHWGALVRVVGNQDRSVAGTTVLVTSDGMLYPFAAKSSADGGDGDVASILGYRSEDLINATVTGALAIRLQRGPLLDPIAARQPR